MPADGRMRPAGRRRPRLLLRSPEREHGEAFVALARKSRRFHGGLVRPPHDLERYAAFLERNRADDFEAFLLVREADQALLGCVNLSQIVRGAFRSAYLGYWIGAPHARQGYMSEGLALVLGEAFTRLKLHRLEANIQPENAASKRLVERLGFRLEGYSPRYLKIAGRWRDHERWAILGEEWRALRKPGAHPLAFRVREATSADAEGVAALFEQSVGGSLEEHRQGFEREIARPDAENLVLVAEARGEIIGFARARRFEPSSPPSDAMAPAGWYLLGVDVVPEHRNKGVGAALTRTRLRWIAERAGQAFYFTDRENQASIALHARFGFQEVSRAVDYPGALGNPDGRVLYRAKLSETPTR